MTTPKPYEPHSILVPIGRRHTLRNFAFLRWCVRETSAPMEEALVAIEQSKSRCKSILGSIKVAFSNEAATFLVPSKHLAAQILQYAEGPSIDHFAVGRRSGTRFDRLLIDSVAQQVVAQARCGVSVLR